MKNYLACALLTVGVIGFNATPAKAIGDIVEINKAQASNKIEVCFYVPWLGRACFG